MTFMVKLVGVVAQREVPVRNSGKGPRPELVPIMDEVIRLVPTNDRMKKSGKEDDIQFVQVRVEDKKDGERVREALRGHLKALGYNVQMATDSKVTKVAIRDERTGKKTAETKPQIRVYVYIAAFSKDLGELQPTEQPSNGAVEKPQRDRKAERERREAKLKQQANA